MKNTLLIIPLLLLAVLPLQAQDITVCTYNLRYKNSGDTDAGNGWNTRRTYLINFVNFQQPDLLGVQEATYAQMTDMAGGLKGYDYVGVGRNDGAQSGEYSAIFYRKERMVLLDCGDFWLSDTPDKPSKGFPSKGGSTTYYRICSWGKFFDKGTGTVIYHFNTHLDLDETNRQQSYYLIRQRIDEIASRTAPVIISGDYNAVQTGDAYKLFYNSGFLYDSYVRAKQRFMTNGTCPGFNAGNYSTVSGELRRIDHIFVTRAFDIKHYGVLNPCYYSTTGTADYAERAYSDHSPVIVKLALRNPAGAELNTELPPMIDGVYQLSTSQELQAFSNIVNGLGGYEQNVKANAALTADIDMQDVTDWMPIGRSNAPFSGKFDGQGHSIRNFSLNSHRSYAGLFGRTSGATIAGFSIDGNITYGDGTGAGVVGWSEGGTIRDVHSSLAIAVTQVAHHIGGVVGSMRTGTKATACSFSGTITDTGGSNDCIGGIAGYTNENCSLEDCANYGDISFQNTEAYAGGIIGYVNNAAFSGVKNCLSTGQIRIASGTPTYSGAIGGRVRNFTASTFQNNYWLEGSAVAVSGENKVQGESAGASRMASGEICYKLNAERADTGWFQTLGDDQFPVLLDDHLRVLLRDGAYINDEATAVRSVPGREEDEASPYTQGSTTLNLAGQRIVNRNASDRKLPHGIYIIGGKKVVK